ncbi:MAG: hypothetical protein NTV34_14565 [Proteobacteria bacterium]|nr:hypothetical protein [Pseudomonadota bacterium]
MTSHSTQEATETHRLGKTGLSGKDPNKVTHLALIGRKLELPILFLSFVWFLVLIIELVNGTNPVLHMLGSAIWLLYILYFVLRLFIGPSPLAIAKKNWLFILAILVSMLRFTPFFQDLPLVRALTATFGMQAIWIVTSAHQGLRSVGRTMGKKQILDPDTHQLHWVERSFA